MKESEPSQEQSLSRRVHSPSVTTCVEESMGGLLRDLRLLIDAARRRVAQAVDSGQVLLYWHIGDRVRREILDQQRAQYGERIVVTVSRQLEMEYGRGFAEKNLRRMILAAELFPDAKFVATLSRYLSWSHIVELLPLKDELRRQFYTELCRVEHWSVRTLRRKIQGMLFERTAISRRPAAVAKAELDALRDEDRMTPDLVFRDPYVLDFLMLSMGHSERDLESALLRELESFLLELGTDFAFLARQKRITIDGQDYYLDLLFFHRRLRRLIAVELKIGDFQAADKGQMELYLRWLAKYEQMPMEEAPIGLILCAGKRSEHVELLQVEQSGIRVAEYLLEMPPRDVLQAKLHQMLHRTQELLSRTAGRDGVARSLQARERRAPPKKSHPTRAAPPKPTKR
jgi:predicted nuclease of restriction endonuclease-like (RecB) superfamily